MHHQNIGMQGQFAVGRFIMVEGNSLITKDCRKSIDLT